MSVLAAILPHIPAAPAPSVVVILALVLIPAMASDVHAHRIPNLLSFGGWLAGIGLHAWLAGIPGIADSLTGLGLLLLITFPFFALGWMGAGDVKLIAAVGAIVGADAALWSLGGIVITGFIVALLAAAWRGSGAGALLRNIADLVGASIVARRPLAVDVTRRETIVLPYGVAIGFGACASLVLAAILRG